MSWIWILAWAMAVLLCMGRRRRTLLWLGARRAMRPRRTPVPPMVDDDEEGSPDDVKRA